MSEDCSHRNSSHGSSIQGDDTLVNPPPSGDVIVRSLALRNRRVIAPVSSMSSQTRSTVTSSIRALNCQQVITSPPLARFEGAGSNLNRTSNVQASLFVPDSPDQAMGRSSSNLNNEDDNVSISDPQSEVGTQQSPSTTVPLNTSQHHYGSSSSDESDISDSDYFNVETGKWDNVVYRSTRKFRPPTHKFNFDEKNGKRNDRSASQQRSSDDEVSDHSESDTSQKLAHHLLDETASQFCGRLTTPVNAQFRPPGLLQQDRLYRVKQWKALNENKRSEAGFSGDSPTFTQLERVKVTPNNNTGTQMADDTISSGHTLSPDLYPGEAATDEGLSQFFKPTQPSSHKSDNNESNPSSQTLTDSEVACLMAIKEEQDLEEEALQGKDDKRDPPSREDSPLSTKGIPYSPTHSSFFSKDSADDPTVGESVSSSSKLSLATDLQSWLEGQRLQAGRVAALKHDRLAEFHPSASETAIFNDKLDNLKKLKKSYITVANIRNELRVLFAASKVPKRLVQKITSRLQQPFDAFIRSRSTENDWSKTMISLAWYAQRAMMDKTCKEFSRLKVAISKLRDEVARDPIIHTNVTSKQISSCRQKFTAIIQALNVTELKIKTAQNNFDSLVLSVSEDTLSSEGRSADLSFNNNLSTSSIESINALQSEQIDDIIEEGTDAPGTSEADAVTVSSVNFSKIRSTYQGKTRQHLSRKHKLHNLTKAQANTIRLNKRHLMDTPSTSSSNK